MESTRIFNEFFMDYRTRKRIIIGIFYLALFLTISYLLYLPFKPPETCSDGRKNQNEIGIDCGGVCVSCQAEPVLDDIVVTETTWVSGGNGNKFDLVAKISNPNNDYGASFLTYVFQAKNSSGVVFFEKSGTSFILPKEEKYIVAISVPLLESPSNISVVLSDVGWEKFSGYKEKPSLDVYNRRFEYISSGVGFGEAKGLVVNNSPFDFADIGIVVVLRDGRSRIIAAQKTDMQTIRSGERRDFTLKWPDSFPGNVERVEVQTDANVYLTDTFIRQYLPSTGKPFQKLESGRDGRRP